MQDGEHTKSVSEHPGSTGSTGSSIRPSRPPHTPTPVEGAFRLVFAAVWIATQIALVLTAGSRPDGAFGFRMFSESSTLRLALYRELPGGVRVHVDGGTWTAHDAGGMARRFSWYDRVKRPEMSVFDTEIHASYGAAAQLARLQIALDDVAAHVPEDAETQRLLLDVTVRRNGREPYVVHLVSAPRGGS